MYGNKSTDEKSALRGHNNLINVCAVVPLGHRVIVCVVMHYYIQCMQVQWRLDSRTDMICSQPKLNFPTEINVNTIYKNKGHFL